MSNKTTLGMPISGQSLHNEEEKKRIDKFHKNVKVDMGDDVNKLLVFIKELLKQNSDDMTVHTHDGSSYNINFQDGGNLKNRMPGQAPMVSGLNTEPSNFTIDVSKDKINMHVYTGKDQRYLQTEFIVGQDLVYNKLEKLLYEHYVNTKKNEIGSCVENLYKVSKLERQRKIKKFLKEDEK